MKEVIFTTDAPPSSEELRNLLLGDENDPASPAYKRVLKRPEISWGKLILSLVGTGGFFALLVWGVFSMGIPGWAKWGSILGVGALFLLIHLKRICISVVELYQRFAPESVRNKCRFEPSCSVYMILSIQKYGVLRGVQKGIDRLKRCNRDNGGFDDP